MQKTLERQDLAPHEAIRDGAQERSTEGPILRSSETETRPQQLGLAIHFCLLSTVVLASLWRALRITEPLRIVGTVHCEVKPQYAGGSLRRFYGIWGAHERHPEPGLRDQMWLHGMILVLCEGEQVTQDRL